MLLFLLLFPSVPSTSRLWKMEKELKWCWILSFSIRIAVKVFVLEIHVQEELMLWGLFMKKGNNRQPYLKPRQTDFAGGCCLFIFISVQNHFDNTLNLRNGKYAVVQTIRIGLWLQTHFRVHLHSHNSDSFGYSFLVLRCFSQTYTRLPSI